MRFKVTHVKDGDTFQVSPNWEFNGKSGNWVRPVGFNTPEKGEPGYQEAKSKLRRLIRGKEVELKNPIKITQNRLLCEAYYEGRNLADFFPEYP